MEKTIYYHDTDAGGVVYYGNYLKYLEEARTNYLVELGLPIEMFVKQEFLYAVHKCTITYHSPARYGDIINCDAKLTQLTAARLFFEQKIHNQKTGQLLLTGDVTLVSLNKQFKPTPIPDDLRRMFEKAISKSQS